MDEKEQYRGYLEDTSEDASHYGTPRHSGRYPWGSGKNPQRNKNFLARAHDLQKQGLTSTQIAKAFNMSTTQYRQLYSVATDEEKAYTQDQVRKMFDKGMSKTAIGKRLGIPESTVRNYLKEDVQARTNATKNISNYLKEQIEQKPYLDVGKGVENQLGITDTQLKAAIERCRLEGYEVVTIKVPQATNPTQKTEVKVLMKNPDGKTETELKREVWQHEAEVTSPEGTYFKDHGETRMDISKPVSLDSKRVSVRYAEDGGEDKDGVIEIRKGVADLSMGNNVYAQVRIAVDDTHYLKGMAIYSEAKDWPPGVDIMFNTSKTKDVPMIGDDPDNTVLKPIKMDKKNPGEYKSPENPFGAVTRDLEYTDENGVKHKSPLNIVNDDTDWEKWSKNLPSQFLSKQPVALAKQQLALAYNQREEEFKDICALTNPTIKRSLLEDFAESCDSASVHLKAAALPRQATHVILPLTSLKENEVYAPNYIHGEEVILVRFPHEGVFQIPKLVVNNSNPEGKKLLGNAEHAIGINPAAAKQLSGADFDGDTVMVIPTSGQKLKSGTLSPALKALKDFNPSHEYPAYEGMTRVGEGDGFNKQNEMGKASNLITDMTIRGASGDEIARAVRYSMTVIDAQKHNLDWKRAAKDNRIAELKRDYQGGDRSGASTLISRAKGPATLPEYKEKRISEMTPEEKERYKNGEKIFTFTDRKYPVYKKDKETGKYLVDDNGELIQKGKLKDAQTRTTKMEAAFISGGNAYDLSSGSQIENIYADHANKLRYLANRARKEMMSTGRLQRNPSAAQTYSIEVKELKSALNIALKNAPYERQAQLIADTIIKAKLRDNPDWDKDEIKKARQLTIKAARYRVGSLSRKKLGIEITPRQWEAIQAGAISDTLLGEILRYADKDKVRALATPKQSHGMGAVAKARARTLLNMTNSDGTQKYTQAEVAEELGVSVATLKKELGGK